MRGEVVRLDAATKVATIRHEKIEGWMEPMTMGFPIANDGDWGKLREGMKLSATVIVQGDDYILSDVQEVK